MGVGGQRGPHAGGATTAEIRQRNACAGQHLPAGIIEKGRIVPDVHVSVVVAMRRHHDRAIHFEAVLHDSSLSGLWPSTVREGSRNCFTPRFTLERMLSKSETLLNVFGGRLWKYGALASPLRSSAFRA